jgi:hypothetical protein
MNAAKHRRVAQEFANGVGAGGVDPHERERHKARTHRGNSFRMDIGLANVSFEGLFGPEKLTHGAFRANCLGIRYYPLPDGMRSSSRPNGVILPRGAATIQV